MAELVYRKGWRDVARDDPDEVPGLSIISVHLEQLARSQAYMPEVRHGWLVWRLDMVDTELARKHGLHGLYPFVQTVTAEELAEARAAGLDVGVWGAETREDLAHAVRVGASGATVGWLDGALEFLREEGLISEPSGQRQPPR